MPDAAARFSGPAALGTSAATVYTVPAVTTAILRNIHVTNETATEASVTLSIGTDGAGKRLFKDTVVPALGVLDWSGFIPLAAAEIVQAKATTASALTLTLSGVLVT